MHRHQQRTFLLLLILLSAACTDILAFDLETQLDEITIPGDQFLHENHVAIDMSKIDNTGFQLKLDGIQGDLDLLEIRLYITEKSMMDPDDSDDFDFLQSLTITLVPINDSELQPQVLGTWQGPGPSGAQEIEMIVTSPPNLTDYIRNGSRFELSMEGIVPPDEISIGGDLKFLVNPV